MEKTFFLSGIGGQGIQLLGKILLYSFNEADINGSYFPTYTGTRRGGYTFCSVVATDGRVGSPNRVQYDYTALMDADSYKIFESKAKPGGVLILNADLIPSHTPREDLRIIALPLTTLAEEAGSSFCFNVILGGIVAGVSQVVPTDIVKKELLGKLGKTEEMKRLYSAAFDKGVEIAAQYAPEVVGA